jgi:hypothetical protein
MLAAGSYFDDHEGFATKRVGRQNDGDEFISEATRSACGVKAENVRSLPRNLFYEGDAFGCLCLSRYPPVDQLAADKV